MCPGMTAKCRPSAWELFVFGCGELKHGKAFAVAAPAQKRDQFLFRHAVPLDPFPALVVVAEGDLVLDHPLLRGRRPVVASACRYTAYHRLCHLAQLDVQAMPHLATAG